MQNENAQDTALGVAETKVKVVTLLESDLPKMVFSGPLSPKTTFTLRVDGPWSASEARKLQKLLALHIECLDEDAQQPS